jgi:hypothetical protein
MTCTVEKELKLFEVGLKLHDVNIVVWSSSTVEEEKE